MKTSLLVSLFCTFFSFTGFAQSSSQLHIEYIGNMGVIISDGAQSVCIDALHVFYDEPYQFPPETLVNSLMNGTYKTYPAIEVAMFTHEHGDHFFNGYGAKLLKKNSSAWVVAASQSCNGVREALGGISSLQIKEVPYDGTQLSLDKGNLCVKGFRLDHANPRRHGKTQNVAFMVEMGGFKLLHVGDSEWEAVERIFPQQKILQENIDIAVLPYWMLMYDDPAEHVKEYIHPKHLIATHIPPDFSRSDQQKIRRIFPKVHLFMEIGKDELIVEKER